MRANVMIKVAGFGLVVVVLCMGKDPDLDSMWMFL